MDKTYELERISVKFKALPHNMDQSSVISALRELKTGKRAMLEASVYALQEGDALLSLIQEIIDEALSLDSRPYQFKKSLLLASGQVRSKIQCSCTLQ